MCPDKPTIGHLQFGFFFLSFFPSCTTKDGEHILFVAFSSLFLLHVFPHFSPCGVIANRALQPLQQRGTGTPHFACAARFRRPAAGCSCIFFFFFFAVAFLRPGRGLGARGLGGRGQQPVTLMGRCRNWPRHVIEQLLTLQHSISFPLSQETSKDVSIEKAPILMHLQF